ncbi:MAG: hypothetical protein GWN18_18720, partial [Thermoplasmata archaeon]|nr:hypothetical protein [Thermoplasmata archaeon]NIS14163.1 hypothetical protein [Thermoplasmata archaeon]NIS22002.1 hypothetical protein [Thermoplasmata archaeon]NIT79861.1 hypothetical protein [Thermoplasmata archaeon]NIU51027.1 hypothetical protein [Thermoplasmata archaeon]
MSEPRRVWTFLLLSLAAGVLVLAIALAGIDPEGEVKESDRRVLGGALMLVCALGIVS